ncbi:hypothetical protein CES85_3067 (plasmid) [Ochrobactrum quorumnocens]|uniref:Uncharacterized protein n=1 Tax=Ochrobactrum quorumnocens TaxID=271865 RepID=A0A248UPT4_9HYPH|nr:DUF6097 family protein [[Ochrobactrum] quorumnocens]ASV88646.1 hypothetical protein CES85_3067 [[Ochrobactrum] quorumnocens]
MNFLHNFGSAILLSQFASRQLEGLHTLMDWKRIPVGKSDDFYRQTLAFDKIVGEGSFGRCYQRYFLIRKAMVALASIIIVSALIVFLLSKVPSLGGQINELIAWLLLDFMRFIYIVSTASGVLLVILVGCHFYSRSLLNRLLGPELAQLWRSIIRKWAPELQNEDALRRNEPDEVAAMIVHYRR